MIKSAPKVTAKQASKNTFEDKKYMNHVINSNYPRKRTFLTPYTWNFQKDDQDTEVYSQNLKKMLNNLLKTKIRDEDSMLLKSEDRPPCNPALVMDLRHEMVKTRKLLKQCDTKMDVVTQAKRVILQEEIAVLAVEKELSAIDKEINSFKRQLELSREKLSHQTTGSHVNAYKKSRHSRSKSVSIIDLDNVQSSSCDIPYSEPFSVLDIETTEHATNHNSAVDYLITDISTSKEETKAITNTDVTTSDGAMKGIIPEISINSTTLESNEEFMYNKIDLLCSVWMKWNRLTLDQKPSMIQNHTCETKDDVSENIQTRVNKKIMRNCWDTWFHMVRERKRTRSAAFSKQQREEKIDEFLKVLQEQKRSLIDIRVPGKIKDLNNVKKGIVKNSKPFNHNFQPNNKRYDKQDVQEISGFQTKCSPRHRNNEYLKRLEVQQNIITEQKSKLEEQSRLIKELQLAQLRMQTHKSAKEAQDEISQTLSSCDLSLKPKAKQVKNRLYVTEKRMVFPERKLAVSSLETVPAILNKMEERAEERQRRWRSIRERKQKLIEERKEKERQEEEERKQREEHEKQLKIQELREKRRLKQQMEIQKKTEREKMHNLMIRASLHYKNLLMKKIICSLKQLVVLKWKMMESAEEHYRTRLVCQYFQTWREHVSSVIRMKMHRATAWHNRVLTKKVFRRLFQVYGEYITKKQVAIDFYDLRMQEHIFISWHCIACTEHVVTVYKQEHAKAHYNRKLLTHYLKRWQQLPLVLHLEREKEQRKQIWRIKVQEILPDFKPVSAMLEDSDLAS